MTTMVGADVEELRVLSSDFTKGAEELAAIATTLTQRLDAATDWQGSDADRLKGQWRSLAQGSMANTASALEHAGRLLAREADEQERTSGSYGGLSVLKGPIDVLKAIKDAVAAGGRVKALARWLMALAKPLGSGGRAAAILAAMRLFKDGGSKLPGILGTIGRTLSRFATRIVVAGAVVDLITGGGYEGWRAWATRGFALAGGAGAVVLMVGASPVVMVGAGVAVTAYALWGLGNSAVDAWQYLRENDSLTKVSESARKIWKGLDETANKVGARVNSAVEWARWHLRGKPLFSLGATTP